LTLKSVQPLLVCLVLVGCQALREPSPSWTEYCHKLNAMGPAELQQARAMALDEYLADPDDWKRLRAGYALSRSDASQKQLNQSLEILSEIPDESAAAPVRDLLVEIVQRTQDLHQSQAHFQNSQKQVRNLNSELAQARTRLDALKVIEQEMVDSQKQADDLQR